MSLYQNFIEWVDKNFLYFDKLNLKKFYWNQNKKKSFLQWLKEEHEAMERAYAYEEMYDDGDNYNYNMYYDVNNSHHTFDDSHQSTINPASGYIMTGNIDIMGNTYGTSSFDYHRS